MISAALRDLATTVSLRDGQILVAPNDLVASTPTGSTFTLFDQFVRMIGLVMLMMGIVIILLRIPRSNELFAWLAIALVSMFCAELLISLGGARYTLGWFVARLSWVVSASVMFMFFVRQFVRRQRALVDMRDVLEGITDAAATVQRLKPTHVDC